MALGLAFLGVGKASAQPVAAPQPIGAAPGASSSGAAPLESSGGSGWTWAPAVPKTDSPPESIDEPQKVKPRVRWRGTALQVSSSVTTTALGVGTDYQSTSYQVVNQDHALLLNYYVLDDPDLRVRVATRPGFNVELSNSGETTHENELVFNDLPLTTVAIAPLIAPEDSLLRTLLLGNFTLTIPTSKYTWGAGERLTLSPRATLMQNVPILGKQASALQSVLFGIGARYDRQFTAAEVAVSDDVERVARRTADAGGVGNSTDVLSGGRLAPHTFGVSGFAFASEDVGDVQVNLSVGGGVSWAYLHPVAGSSRELLTGPVEVTSSGEGRDVRPRASFAAGLTIVPISEFAIALGYSNTVDLDAPTPNTFYAPGAQFSAGLSINLDAIYEAATGPRRTEPFILF